VYCGSFSKLISPGLRVGAAIVSKDLLRRKMIIGKQSTDVHSPTLNQAIVAEYLGRGLLEAHLARICADYRAQMNEMLARLAAFPDGVSHTTPEGGLFIWARLPDGMDAVQLLNRAVERGVAYVPGTYFYPGGGHLETFRLNFSNSDIEKIDRGMDVLGEIIREAM
jgi:2-aminoadipate transaminase